MMDRRALGEHLRFFEELGVVGVSRERVWRARDDGAGRSALGAGEHAAGEDVSSAQPPAPSAVEFESLPALRAHIGDCTRCKLHRMGRKQVVFGVGNPNARLMFVGEAPGADEDQQGEPFVGKAGQLLTKIIEAIGLKRGDVYIANVIKCRPPSNRDPLPEEIGSCSDWLTRQIDIIRPKLIVTLGRYSMARFLPGNPISRIHGQAKKINGTWMVPMYHPAAALHQGSLRRTIEDDFSKIPAYLDQARRDLEAQKQPVLAAATPEPAQMKLL
jgi:uracil-DNA glycosylase